MTYERFGRTAVSSHRACRGALGRDSLCSKVSQFPQGVLLRVTRVVTRTVSYVQRRVLLPCVSHE